jgi:broad specificity phosphatase PhoE
MTNTEVELYALRHAESALNVKPHIIGGRSIETPITPKGVVQARTLGYYMLQENIIPHAVYASPAVRPRDTAKYTLEVMGIDIEPTIDDALQELDQGEWVGLNRDDIYTPERIAEIGRQGKDFKAPGGESMNEAGERMFNRVSEIADRHAEEGKVIRIFVFTHGLAIRCLASHIHNWSRKQTFDAVTPNASISRFDRLDKTWMLRYLGKAPELTS